MIGQRYLLCISLFLHSHTMHGQMLQKLKEFENTLKSIEQMLYQPLNNTLIQNIETNLAVAHAKIILLKNALSISQEHSNPFLSSFIDELIQQKESLERSFKLEKEAFQKISITRSNNQDILPLLDEWNLYKLESLQYFLPPTLDEPKNLYAFSTKRLEKNQHIKSTIYAKLTKKVEEELKKLQNSLFTLTLSYQKDCDNAFNDILTCIEEPPQVPKRTSSLPKETQKPPVVISEQSPALPIHSKSFLETVKEQATKIETVVKEQTKAAKEYAKTHLLSIEQKLRDIPKPETPSTVSSVQPLQTEQILKTAEKKSTKINTLVNHLYTNTSVYNGIILDKRFKEICTLMEFIHFSTIDPFDSAILRLRQVANTIIVMLDKTIENLIKKQQELSLKHKDKGNLYYSLFVFPTVFYSMLISKKMAWLSDSARNLYQHQKYFLQKKSPTLSTGIKLLSQEERELVLKHTKNILLQESFLTGDAQLKIYFFLHSMLVITGYFKTTPQLYTPLSKKALFSIVLTKKNIVSFINNSVIKALQSPFPLEKTLFHQLFLRLSAFEEIVPLLLLQEIHNNVLSLWSNEHYKQVDIENKAIKNALQLCRQKAKERAHKELNLTAPALLSEQIERILALIEEYTDPQSI